MDGRFCTMAPLLVALVITSDTAIVHNRHSYERYHGIRSILSSDALTVSRDLGRPSYRMQILL